MTDLVERLRDLAKYDVSQADCLEAADEIERLRELFRVDGDFQNSLIWQATDEIERLRTALGDIAALPAVDGGEVEKWNRQQELRLNEQARQIAIRALKEKAGDVDMAKATRETQEELQRLNELDEWSGAWEKSDD